MQLHGHWFFLRLHIREIVAGLALLGLAAGLIAMSWLPYRAPNFGFGPEWACSSDGHGGPVCVKRSAGSENP